MKNTFIFLILSTFVLGTVQAQDLLKERIWKLSDRKKSIFLDSGIFHSQRNAQVQELKNIRNSYFKTRGYERLVFDFSGQQIPRVYGHISDETKKINIDFFNVTVNSNIGGIKKIKYLDEIKFFSIEKDQVSMELIFNSSVSYDIFYLQNPARIVIDIKK